MPRKKDDWIKTTQVFIFCIYAISFIIPMASAAGNIAQVKSGFVAADQLNANKTQQQLQNQGYWVYNGSAVAKDPYSFFENSSGLYTGTKAIKNGKYAGFFAATPNTDAYLFHSVVSALQRTVPRDFFQTGMYVQTRINNVNYVSCVAVTSSAGTVWTLVGAVGSIYKAKTITTFWTDNSPNQPLTRDCMIITNGANYLEAYIDGVKVYQNSSLDLQMPLPFNAYLEVQNSDKNMNYGAFKDFYITADEAVRVINMPDGTNAEIIDGSGNILANQQEQGGTATLQIAGYNFPLHASLEVYGNDTELASTPVQDVYGGDVYSYPSNAMITVQSIDMSGNAITGLWTSITSSGVVSSGFTPFSYITTPNTQFTVTMADYQQYVFDHWLDTGSMNRNRDMSIPSDTNITAVYRIVGNSTGHAQVSIDTIDSSNNVLAGYWTVLWQNGMLVQSGFSPTTFSVNASQTYNASVGDYGNYVFDHWTDGVTDRFHTVNARTKSLTAVYRQV